MPQTAAAIGAPVDDARVRIRLRVRLRRTSKTTLKEFDHGAERGWKVICRRRKAKGGAVSSHQVVHAGDVEASHGVFRALTDRLGVAGFRVNQLELAAGAEGPEHDHAGNGQEEVYAVIGGGGVLRADGEEIPLRPGHFVYCPAAVRRQMVAGDDGLTWIGIGSAITETG